MEINAIFDLFPGEAMLLFESGIVFAAAVFFFFGILDDLIRLFEGAIWQKRKAAFCLGIHTGTINSVCRNHACPHSRQCIYHVPRRTPQHMILLVKQKLKRHS